MQTTYFWNKLDLRRGKVIFLLFLAFLFSSEKLSAQGLFGMTSTSGSDDKLVSYGFFLAGHNSTYRLEYSNAFLNAANPAAGDVRAIFPRYNPGFSLGFIGMLRFHDQVQLLFTPKVGFYEFKTEVHFFPDNFPGNNTPSPDEPVNSTFDIQTYTSEATMVELPLLMKYKSVRFNNTRMYFLGGGSYQFRTKSQEEANLEDLVTTGQDFTIEMGMGFEIYFKFFKFAPEIRFSHGLNNLYQAENTNPDIRDALTSVRRKTITLYLNFQ
ncbi:probable protein-translocating porin PorT [Algoriphagus ornithinivorans]|uniref:Probable protein-translocating porin PorT n=2 Tax=Algoriphagus TaxID=246875 RepID=A0A1I5EXP1_9BACT|nr:porin family protein [Algoriphagus ornithinivorans]SFO16298.1 probable protein-translocating porin PorT [Algoriphagus ornithinivorans]